MYNKFKITPDDFKESTTWDSNEYESILPVTLQTVEYYETQA